MIRKIACAAVFFISQPLTAANPINLYHAPISSLNNFELIQQPIKKGLQITTTTKDNQLKFTQLTKLGNETIYRYQQLYKGIPVVGGQVMLIRNNQQTLSSTNNNAIVNGQLINDLTINTKPTITLNQAINLTKKKYLANTPNASLTAAEGQLQIRSNNNKLKLVYLVSFKSHIQDNTFSWPFFIVDAQNGDILKQWNNIKKYQDTGPGGNEKVHEYWYGKDGLPGLPVTRSGDNCKMDDGIVKLVNLKSTWDWLAQELTAWEYQCDNNTEDLINGAFSPINDAYFFGHTVVEMYKDWYGIHALQTSAGDPMQLVMRVHFGKGFDNAYWNDSSNTMTFGDGNGDLFYPLVSLDIAAHEISHGFTSQHSMLEYYDQSGALNESFSDMAGQAARAYLHDTNLELYKKSNIKTDTFTWGIGETVIKEGFNYKALRFMDDPSADGSSADCLDKELAKKSGEICKISYDDIVNFAQNNIFLPEDQQDFIVHTASGVFNKAFYLLADKIGIKQAFHIMLLANVNYWTPTATFKDAACDVIHAAKELNTDTNLVKSIFNRVGVETNACPDFT